MAPSPAQLGNLFSRRNLLWSLFVLLFFLGLIDWLYERHRERRYDSHILRTAARYRLQPGLVKAVVWRESKFDPKARGSAGEIGLMQIRSLAAKEWAQQEKHRPEFEGNLFDPETNLQVGAWYLARLCRRYSQTDNPAAYALADYNAGRSHVLRWNRGRAQTNSVDFLRQITFPGTREYVRAILSQAPKFQSRFARLAPSSGI